MRKTSPASETRADRVSELWRANPFHRPRLGDSVPQRIERWGADPRVGDPERGGALARGAWRIASERLAGEHALPWNVQHPSRHFTARLHAFSWLIDLAAIGAHERMAALIESWVESYGEWDEFHWDPELTAERVFAWLCWGRAAIESAPPPRREKVLRSLARQVRLLLLEANDLGERRLGAIKAGAALAIAGAAGLPDAERLREQGEEMLVEACAKQFLPDGGHLSRAPEAVLDALCDLLAASVALEAVPAMIRDLLPKLANMVRFFRLGDGGLSCFHGGSAAASATIEAALAQVRDQARPFLFAERSGFQRLVAGPMIALFDVGSAPPAAYSERAHASALAFELSSEGERLIVNVGAAREASPPLRVAARATNGHSTLIVGDALSANLEGARRGRARLSGPELDDVRRSADDSGVTVQGRHDGYREKFGLLHRRYVFMDAEGKNLRGIDELIRPTRLRTAPARRTIPFVVRFHLHPDVRARPAEQGVVMLETLAGQRWRFRTDAPASAATASIYWGGPEPRDAQQIVLSGDADPMGHGLSPPNRVRWALARLG
jgi:uncharacterized heparinase superfamily protein